MRLPAFLSLVLSTTVAAQLEAQIPLPSQEGDSDCHNACTSLLSSLGPDLVYYNPTTPLTSFQSSFYSQQQRTVIPACILTPTSAPQISLALSILRQHTCIFAVKSGGHAMFPGASNAPGGVTFDMKNLNFVEVGEDGQTTRVGTGNTWGDVYKVLDPRNLTVVGGRDTGVGVGGFTLGGGISFLSRKYGWAADNVKNYEVVLANSTIAKINPSSAPDLYWALRGGGNNFGIVTTFTLETYPQGPAWGSFLNVIPASPAFIASRLSLSPLSTNPPPLSKLQRLTHTIAQNLLSGLCKLGYCSTAEPVFRALKNYALQEPGDANAQVLLSIFRNPHTGLYAFNTATVYSEPVVNPPVFKEWLDLPIIYHTRKLRSLSSIAAEIDSLCPPGMRNIWSAVSFKLDESLLAKLMDIFIEESEAVGYVEGIVPNMSFQLLNREEISLMQKNGGNCLGIKAKDWPLIVLTVTFAWKNIEDDHAVHTAEKNIVDRLTSTAKEMGLHHRYIYQNYANISQDVFAGYGEENRKRLLKIQKKYDPEGVFSRLQPGYFKL